MDSITVIKIGGKVLNQQPLLDEFLLQFSELEGAKVLVHGGGILATQLAERMGVNVHMKEGRRITDSDMRDVVVMMYGGLVNK
ncbi:MAG: acetylglutamate kinase, partial [Cyclobacteriaceae bacterium]